METYRHSGVVPLGGALLTTLVGLIATALYGVIYTFAVVWIPFIYVTFLLTLGFGFLIGLTVGGLATFGRIRNTFVLGAIALLMALFGIYVEWGTSPLALGMQEIGILGFLPDVMWWFVQYLYQNGSWRLFGDDNVSGIPLAIIWLIEAGTIIFIAVTVAIGKIGDQAFCEQCNAWIQNEEGVQAFRADESDLESIVSGNLVRLSDLTRADGSEMAVIRLDLACCMQCDTNNFLTLQAVQVTVDDDGNVKEEKTSIVEHLAVHKNQIEAIRHAGKEPAMSAEELVDESDEGDVD